MERPHPKCLNESEIRPRFVQWFESRGEGGATKFDKKQFLGEGDFSGIPPAPRGAIFHPAIMATFTVAKHLSLWERARAVLRLIVRR